MNRESIREFFDSDSSKALLGLIAVLAVGFLAQNSPSFGNFGQDEQMERLNYQKAAPTAITADGGAGSSSYARSNYEAISAHITLEVDEVSDSLEEIRSLTDRYAGKVDSSSIYRDESDSGNIQVRVPKNNYTGFIAELEEKGKIESKTTNSDNLKERYTELKLELENKRQELNRLEELINRTDSVENLIKIQERMSELRSRIQFLEQQLDDLDRRISYVRISIQLQEPQPFTSEFEIRQTFVDSYKAVLSSIRMIIVGAGYLVPFAVLWLVFKRSRSFLRARREQESE